MKEFNKSVTLFIILLGGFFLACEKPKGENRLDDDGNEDLLLSVICQVVDATEVDYSSAKLSGTFTISNAKEANGKACFYYSSTTSDANALKSSSKIEAGNVFTEGGSFSASIFTLSPSTTYYFAASISIDGKEFMSDVKSFTTKDSPKDPVITGDASSISVKSVMLSGTINPTSEMQDVFMGVFYSLDSNPNIYNSEKIKATEIKENSFSVTIDDLSSSTTYYYKAYIQFNGEQYRFGETKSFTTKPIEASVTTVDASDITEFKGTINGILEVDSVGELTKEVWFLFSKTANNEAALIADGIKLTATLTNDNTFYAQLTNLDYGETYYYIAAAEIHDKRFYGEIKRLNTNQITVSLSEECASEITEFSASLNAKLSIDCTESIDKEVWFLFSETANSIDDLLVSGIKLNSTLHADGTFTHGVFGLDYGKEYSFVAAAKVHDRLIYSDQLRRFVTKDISAVVNTNEASSIEYTKASLNGKVESISNASLLKQVYFIYSDMESSLDGLVERGTILLSSLKNDDSYDCSLNALHNGSSYHYVAAAEVYDKVYYGEVVDFTTLAYSISVSTLPASNVSVSSAILKGRVTCVPNNIPFSPFFYYSDTESTVAGLISNGERVSVESEYDNSFSLQLANLNPKSRYYFIAGSQLDGDDYYGDLLYFDTGEAVLEPIDLGLTVKWASCNIGAATPEDYGCYYAWAEIRTKKVYNQDNYKWYDSKNKTYTKYNSWYSSHYYDGKHDLDLDDDVAYVLSEGRWRMPTAKQVRELLFQCDWEYVTQNGRSGYLGTSKINNLSFASS